MPSGFSPIQSYYAARAEEYDDVYRKPERQSDLRAIERWLPAVFAGATVLEIACGTGYWTRFIAPAAAAVAAIDSAPETLRLAEQRSSANNVEFRVGDAYDLRPDGRRFTAAFAGFWFSHVPLERQREFLSGLDAALQPGAKVVLLDNRYVVGSSSPIVEHDASGNTYQSRRLKDGSEHRVLKNFPSQSQLRSLLEADVGQSATFSTWRHYWALEYSVPERSGRSVER